VFNTTFSNISAISWQPVLVVEEAGVHGENMGKQLINFCMNTGSASYKKMCFCQSFYNLMNQQKLHSILIITFLHH